MHQPKDGVFALRRPKAYKWMGNTARDHSNLRPGPASRRQWPACRSVQVRCRTWCAPLAGSPPSRPAHTNQNEASLPELVIRTIRYRILKTW